LFDGDWFDVGRREHYEETFGTSLELDALPQALLNRGG
jgi:hypothetical protein